MDRPLIWHVEDEDAVAGAVGVAPSTLIVPVPMLTGRPGLAAEPEPGCR